MIKFQDKEYQLFFSNNLEPLRALNYADELFFNEFERLCGLRYRILSIIRQGWQEKYGLQNDIDLLKKHFSKKLTDKSWAPALLEEFENKKAILVKTLNEQKNRPQSKLENIELFSSLHKIRTESATLDAMSNMLHLFSSLVGEDFISRLKKYSQDTEVINKNFIFFTQPIRESKYAKILMPEFAGKLTLSPEDQVLSDVLRAGAYIKDDVSALLEERGASLSDIFGEISNRLNVNVSDLGYLSLQEIGDALNEKKDPSSLILQRKDITIIFYSTKNLQIYEGGDAETFLKQGAFGEVSFNNEGISELKGQTASLGKATGRAVVVKNSNEAIAQVGVGDILVAPYTAPEYLPVMRKAVAIVTETGGITSHAAIVSRELGIPCVIGVHDVISILHTGDLVEVDANEGVVRIIEKAKS